jgi:DNA-binding transcriptional ArsR family regulator
MTVRYGKEPKGAAASRRAAGGQEKQRSEVLHHPWRTRILEVLNERDMSVSQFVDEGLISDLAEQPRDRAISALAYHFRALREAGALEIVEQNPRRGSTELVCRACARALVTDKEWSQLPRYKRQALSRVMLDSFIARAESAVHRDTFDSRLDRHIAWLAMEVDEQGWSELAGVLNGVLDTVTAIHHESKERLGASGEQPIRATWGQLHFESPPLPPSTPRD